jgi:Pvc16 N-terminal domain
MADVIHNVLDAIRQSANQYLQNIDHRDDDWVVLANLTAQGGTPNEGSQGKVVMCLYNITHETTISTYQPVRQSALGMYTVAPPLYIDLHVMFMANFADRQYGSGLGAMSRLITFLQQNPTLTHATNPRLDPSVEKITLEFVNLDLSELNHVLGMMGVSYLPAIFYKLRMITFASPAMQSQVYPARGGGIFEKPVDLGLEQP